MAYTVLCVSVGCIDIRQVNIRSVFKFNSISKIAGVLNVSEPFKMVSFTSLKAVNIVNGTFMCYSPLVVINAVNLLLVV